MQDSRLVQLVQGHCGLDRYCQDGLGIALESGRGGIALKKVFHKFEIRTKVERIHNIAFPGKAPEQGKHFDIRLETLVVELQGIALSSG